uniref:Transposase n=1 Tax=Panagrellus redivivus TaxID=6233 RepID=A0A7E4VXR0_PANRE
MKTYFSLVPRCAEVWVGRGIDGIYGDDELAKSDFDEASVRMKPVKRSKFAWRKRVVDWLIRNCFHHPGGWRYGDVVLTYDSFNFLLTQNE